MFDTKKEIYVFLSKMYNFAKSTPDGFKIGKIKRERSADGEMIDIAGICWADDAEILLDWRQDLIPSSLHEFCHMQYPSWSEKKVIAAEKKLMSRLTRVQAVHILEMLSMYATGSDPNKKADPNNYTWNGKRMVPKETKKRKPKKKPNKN